mmetsp:Transcript_1196/g.3834  ORF Transcript_1196/g.3834 Transcript_1196/m.3834 type:complete len:555 (-) Transcript_1196:255-1919(-)
MVVSVVGHAMTLRSVWRLEQSVASQGEQLDRLEVGLTGIVSQLEQLDRSILSHIRASQLDDYKAELFAYVKRLRSAAGTDASTDHLLRILDDGISQTMLKIQHWLSVTGTQCPDDKRDAVQFMMMMVQAECVAVLATKWDFDPCHSKLAGPTVSCCAWAASACGRRVLENERRICRTVQQQLTPVVKAQLDMLLWLAEQHGERLQKSGSFSEALAIPLALEGCLLLSQAHATVMDIWPQHAKELGLVSLPSDVALSALRLENLDSSGKKYDEYTVLAHVVGKDGDNIVAFDSLTESAAYSKLAEYAGKARIMLSSGQVKLKCDTHAFYTASVLGYAVENNLLAAKQGNWVAFAHGEDIKYFTLDADRDKALAKLGMLKKELGWWLKPWGDGREHSCAAFIDGCQLPSETCSRGLCHGDARDYYLACMGHPLLAEISKVTELTRAGVEFHNATGCPLTFDIWEPAWARGYRKSGETRTINADKTWQEKYTPRKLNFFFGPRRGDYLQVNTQSCLDLGINDVTIERNENNKLAFTAGPPGNKDARLQVPFLTAAAA